MTRIHPRRGSLFFLAALCLLGLTLIFAGVPFSRAAKPGLVVTPLDEGVQSPGSGGVSTPGQGGGNDAVRSEPGSEPGSGPGSGAETVPGSAPGMDGEVMQAFPEQPSYKDGIIMAYLIELMRKQDKPCPSGAKPSVPPSLLFSEPLCRVAEKVAQGAAFPAAFEEQGIYASHWRMFSAGDQPAQTVAMRLRAEHCEALMEPYTHIGAWHGPSGWRIVLGTLTDKPPVKLNIVPSDDAAPTPATPATPAPGGPATPVAPAVAGDAGQEARAIFLLMNDIRAKGGSCLGQPSRTAPPLTFNAALQTEAEKDAADAASKGSFGAVLGVSPDIPSGTVNYPGSKVTKLTAASRSPASVVVDTWMVSPTHCTTLLSPNYLDVGAAYVDGYWVILMGQRTATANP